MKKFNNDPKNNFNSEYEREKYLNFFGETLIFFGSILKLIWINENKPNKMKINSSFIFWIKIIFWIIINIFHELIDFAFVFNCLKILLSFQKL